MTPKQREAALRLTSSDASAMNAGQWIREADALLRELAAEPAQEPLTNDLLRRARNLLSHPVIWRADPRNSEACYALGVEIDQHLNGIGEAR